MPANEVPIEPSCRIAERGQNIRFESLQDKSLEGNHHLGFVCALVDRSQKLGKLPLRLSLANLTARLAMSRETRRISG